MLQLHLLLQVQSHKKLDANIFIYGSINQAGTTIRVNAQLIDSKTERSFKSFEIEGPSEKNDFPNH